MTRKGQGSLPMDMIPRRNLFRGIWYSAEIYLERSDSLRKFVLRGLIPRGNLFRRVWNPMELFLPGYQIPLACSWPPQNQFNRLWEPGNTFEETLFQNCLYVQATVYYPRHKRLMLQEFHSSFFRSSGYETPEKDLWNLSSRNRNWVYKKKLGMDQGSGLIP